jgi:hypothetical protein
MATQVVRQVLPRSVDAVGISVSTSTCQVNDPRQGQFYNLSTLAAASPIWFHRMPNDSYVAVLSRRLKSATVTPVQRPSGPLLYQTFTEITVPSWAIFNPATGAVSSVANIPSNTDGTRVLTAAVSRGDYLFLLSTIGDKSLIQHFRVGTREALVLQAEEIIPLSLGLYADRNDLWVFSATGGLLTMARKNWGRVGNNTSLTPRMRWRYWSGRGWSSDPAESAALPGNIPAQGPVSVAELENRFYLTVPFYNSGTAAVLGTGPVVTEVPADTILQKARTVLEDLLSGYGDVPPPEEIFQAILQELSNSTGLDTTGVSTVIDQFSGALSGIVEGFVGFIDQLTGGIITNTQPVINQIADAFNDALTALIGTGDITITAPGTPPVLAVPGTWVARAYTTRAIDSQWSLHPFTLPLGNDRTYCGGTVQLQPQLPLTSGYTSTPGSYQETVLDGGSDYIQMFTGLSGHTVRMPSSAAQATPAIPDTPPVGNTPAVRAKPATYYPYTLYNKTFGELRVLSSSGQQIAVLRRGTALVLTPKTTAPVNAANWVTAPATDTNPVRRLGFPYVYTVRKTVAPTATNADTNLITAWGVFGV